MDTVKMDKVNPGTTRIWRSGPAAGVKVQTVDSHRELTDFFNGATSTVSYANGGGNGPRPLNGLQLALGRMAYRLEKAGEATWHAQNRWSETAGRGGAFIGAIFGSMVQWMIGSTAAQMVFGGGIVPSFAGGIAGFIIGGKVDRWLGEKIPYFGDRTPYATLSAGMGAAAFEGTVNVTLGGFAHPAMWVGKNAQKAIGYNPWRDPKRPRL